MGKIRKNVHGHRHAVSWLSVGTACCALAWGSACGASGKRETLRDARRAAGRDFDCPAESVTATEAMGIVSVDACGTRAQYRCDPTVIGPCVCVRAEGEAMCPGPERDRRDLRRHPYAHIVDDVHPPPTADELEAWAASRCSGQAPEYIYSVVHLPNTIVSHRCHPSTESMGRPGREERDEAERVLRERVVASLHRLPDVPECRGQGLDYAFFEERTADWTRYVGHCDGTLHVIPWDGTGVAYPVNPRVASPGFEIGRFSLGGEALLTDLRPDARIAREQGIITVRSSRYVGTVRAAEVGPSLVPSDVDPGRVVVASDEDVLVFRTDGGYTFIGVQRIPGVGGVRLQTVQPLRSLDPVEELSVLIRRMRRAALLGVQDIRWNGQRGRYGQWL